MKTNLKTLMNLSAVVIAGLIVSACSETPKRSVEVDENQSNYGTGLGNDGLGTSPFGTDTFNTTPNTYPNTNGACDPSTGAYTGVGVGGVDPNNLGAGATGTGTNCNPNYKGITLKAGAVQKQPKYSNNSETLPGQTNPSTPFDNSSNSGSNPGFNSGSNSGTQPQQQTPTQPTMPDLKFPDLGGNGAGGSNGQSDGGATPPGGGGFQNDGGAGSGSGLTIHIKTSWPSLDGSANTNPSSNPDVNKSVDEDANKPIPDKLKPFCDGNPKFCSHGGVWVQ